MEFTDNFGKAKRIYLVSGNEKLVIASTAGRACRSIYLRTGSQVLNKSYILNPKAMVKIP